MCARARVHVFVPMCHSACVPASTSRLMKADRVHTCGHEAGGDGKGKK